MHTKKIKEIAEQKRQSQQTFKSLRKCVTDMACFGISQEQLTLLDSIYRKDFNK